VPIGIEAERTLRYTRIIAIMEVCTQNKLSKTSLAGGGHTLIETARPMARLAVPVLSYEI
jgi:hypothetical protein